MSGHPRQAAALPEAGPAIPRHHPHGPTWADPGADCHTRAKPGPWLLFGALEPRVASGMCGRPMRTGSALLLC